MLDRLRAHADSHLAWYYVRLILVIVFLFVVWHFLIHSSVVIQVVTRVFLLLLLIAGEAALCFTVSVIHHERITKRLKF